VNPAQVGTKGFPVDLRFESDQRVAHLCQLRSTVLNIKKSRLAGLAHRFSSVCAQVCILSDRFDDGRVGSQIVANY